MFEFFDFLIGVVQNLILFVANLVQSVVTFFAQISEGYKFVMAVVAYLPPFCQGALLAIVGLSLLAMILSVVVDMR